MPVFQAFLKWNAFSPFFFSLRFYFQSLNRGGEGRRPHNSTTHARTAPPPPLGAQEEEGGKEVRYVHRQRKAGVFVRPTLAPPLLFLLLPMLCSIALALLPLPSPRQCQKFAADEQAKKRKLRFVLAQELVKSSLRSGGRGGGRAIDLSPPLSLSFLLFFSLRLLLQR